MHEKTTRIRELNDALRTTLAGGIVVTTDSVKALPAMVQANALVLMAQFDAFGPENDPHGTHDFGNFVFCGRTFYFKIDCYDPDLAFGSEDPADPAKTTRVLTLMLAEDY
jgi:hypothetical protein